MLTYRTGGVEENKFQPYAKPDDNCVIVYKPPVPEFIVLKMTVSEYHHVSLVFNVNFSDFHHTFIVDSTEHYQLPMARYKQRRNCDCC